MMNSSASSKKMQSRCPLQEQLLQRRNSRENVERNILILTDEEWLVCERGFQTVDFCFLHFSSDDYWVHGCFENHLNTFAAILEYAWCVGSFRLSPLSSCRKEFGLLTWSRLA